MRQNPDKYETGGSMLKQMAGNVTKQAEKNDEFLIKANN